MVSYTQSGIRVAGSLSMPTRIIPWDSVKRCRTKDGALVVRHTLKLKEEHFPLYVIGNGVGGFRKERDAGRTLTVDRLVDGRHIDYLSERDVQSA